MYEVFVTTHLLTFTVKYLVSDTGPSPHKTSYKYCTGRKVLSCHPGTLSSPSPEVVFPFHVNSLRFSTLHPVFFLVSIGGLVQIGLGCVSGCLFTLFLPTSIYL